MAPRSAAGPLARGRHSRLPVGATVESSDGLEGRAHRWVGRPAAYCLGAESQVLNLRRQDCGTLSRSKALVTVAKGEKFMTMRPSLIRTYRVFLPVVMSGLVLIDSAFGQTKSRARDLGIPLDGTPGSFNAITDVAGVEVGYTTLVSGQGKRVVGQGPVRTGVTAILPRGRATLEPVFAAFFAGNGNGDMTGTHWVEESGVMETPIMITNTLSVGVVRDAVVSWMVKRGVPGPFWYPVVAETSDGRLNDMKGQHVKAEHVTQALESAHGGHIDEGNVGGGTGMNCHGFKGGTGTASRKLSPEEGSYVVGVLAQCNYGTRSQLRIAGIPVGREIEGYEPCVAQRKDPPVRGADGQSIPVCAEKTKSATPRKEPEQGSIIVVVATDAPLTPDQLKRVARRVSLGMGRMGTIHGNGSGDIFVAFSTANRGVDWGNSEPGRPLLPPPSVARLASGAMEPLFTATVEATEEAIINAMVAAETMTGADFWRSHAIPHDQLRAVLRQHGRLIEAR
jgi:D-aminopeptidase